MKSGGFAKVTTALGAVALALSLALAGPAQAVCVGDCDNQGGTDIGELQRCVNIVLNILPLANCPNCDANRNGMVEIGEVQQAVNSILTPQTCPTVVPGGDPVCGNGIVEEGEECDDGGGCRDGDNDGTLCTSDAECTGGGTCVPFGGDGCAANCTEETIAVFQFTGAKCFGGAKNNDSCSFQANCAGGTKPGRPCGANADCPGGSCVSECGADSRGCFGDGECLSGPTTGASCAAAPPRPPGLPTSCVGGSNANNPCVTGADCPGGTCVARACAGGANAGIPCTADANCPGSTCTAICGGGLCANKSRATLTSVTVPILIGPLIGQQTTHYGKAGADGLIPIANPVAGTSFQPVIVPGLACACVRGGNDPTAHGPGNSGSGIINCGAGTIANDITLARDHSTLPPRVCAGGPNAGTPCSPRCSNALSPDFGKPCTILGTNSPDCAGATGAQRNCGANVDCGAGPTGGVCTSTNGGGICSPNSQNAGRVCAVNAQCLGAGATCQGLCTSGPNIGATCNCDGAARACTNTTQCGAGGGCTITGIRGGGFCMGPPKFCAGGTSAGRACYNNSECPGGTCPGTGNFLAWCDDDGDCPGSRCNSIDDATCSATEPPPPDGSGATACRELKQICTAGPGIGEPCTADASCGVGGTCGTQCSGTSPHPNVCNSPAIITLTGAGGSGSALLLSTTAIGTFTAGDGGTCSYAARCTGGASNGQACLVAEDCPGGNCATAICHGFCSVATTTACLTNADCGATGGTCVPGANINIPCSGVNPQAECGANAICRAVDPAKGFDGLPCTADDIASAQGVPQTIPQTTGRSTTVISDTDATPGAQHVHAACFSGALNTDCAGTVAGTPFDCSLITSGNPSPAGVRLANTFPALDGVTGDGVVTTFLTAR